jgi:hypothetical protein
MGSSFLAIGGQGMRGDEPFLTTFFFLAPVLIIPNALASPVGMSLVAVGWPKGSRTKVIKYGFWGYVLGAGGTGMAAGVLL